MALLDSIRGLLGRRSEGWDHPQLIVPSASDVLGMSPEELYRSQPHLRTVVSFLARNTAHIPLHTFERVSDTDRRRLRSDPLAALMSRPNEHTTRYELMYRLESDLKLYDVAIWALAPDIEAPSGWSLLPIPPRWVQSTSGGTPWHPRNITLVRPDLSKRVKLENKPGEPPQFILFHGYDPGDLLQGSPPVEALKDILAEQIQAWSYRRQVWKRGGRVGTYLSRPAEAPQWSAAARKSFAEEWKDKWTGRRGSEAGGTPLLEDGMTLRSVRFNAREEEWSEVAKLALVTCASVYHISPTMVGVLDNANYSNVREFKQMLYTDTLGPDFAQIESRINHSLAPWVSESGDAYVEFNVAEKLQGNFEEQAAVISTSVGRPWMTPDEARARFNMSELGGDASQLSVPLNVLIGGQASPQDSGSQNVVSAPRPERKASVPLSKADSGRPPVSMIELGQADDGRLTIKSKPGDEEAKQAEHVLKRFFHRQRESVLPKIKSKAPSWWDAERWNRELSDDLYQLAMDITSRLGRETLRELGVDPEEYSQARTVEFLKAVADSRAEAINATTRQQIEDALSGEYGEDAEKSTPEGVFDVAESSRSDSSGLTLATTLVGFAVGEAASQLNRPNTTKTWVVRSGNPRPEHARMNGETVPVDQKFSNGADWPGDAVLGADGVAGCMCGVDITTG